MFLGEPIPRHARPGSGRQAPIDRPPLDRYHARMATDRESNTHFVATLKVERVQRNVQSTNAAGKVDRVIDEVTHMTIKASDLESLKSRLNGHIKLVEED